jgi:2-polyprenyl-3-methyl-5-hydroxy-6-metoxy-1,4-benzoquinol methylase
MKTGIGEPTKTNIAGYPNNPREEMHRFIPKNIAYVLDVGCHTGAFGKSIKQLGIKAVWGIEPNPSTAAIASRNLDKVFVGYFSQIQLPDSFFDAIIFNDVLEHMANPETALRTAAKKLKPNGVVVASIPNIRHIDNLIHILKEKDFRYELNGIRDDTHLRFFTEKSIKRMFEENGYSISILEGINESWWSPSILRRLSFRLFKEYLSDTRFINFAVVAKRNSNFSS